MTVDNSYAYLKVHPEKFKGSERFFQHPCRLLVLVGLVVIGLLLLAGGIACISYIAHRKVRLERLAIEMCVSDDRSIRCYAYELPGLCETLLVFEDVENKRMEAFHLADDYSYIAFAVPGCVELRKGTAYVDKVVLQGAPYTNLLDAEFKTLSESLEFQIVGHAGKMWIKQNGERKLDDSHESLHLSKEDSDEQTGCP